MFLRKGCCELRVSYYVLTYRLAMASRKIACFYPDSNEELVACSFAVDDYAAMTYG